MTFNAEEFTRTMTIQEQHQQLVSTSFKQIDGRGGKMELLHAILGLAGEVGELVDAVKKHVFYEKALDVANTIEEMGDVEYYMEALRQNLQAAQPDINFSREWMLSANLIKLRKRYPGEKFSNAKAVERADKIPATRFEPGSSEWHEFQARIQEERNIERGF